MAPQSATVPAAPALLLDLYELTIAQSYFDHGMHAPATFSLFARHLPPGWGYFVAAGLDDVLTYLETLAFDAGDLDYLRSTGLFTEPFLALLGRLRFTGSVRALEEGTVFFPNEPVLEVTAPIIEAQIVETVVFNQVHLQTIIASKAARCVEAAQGQRLVDFSLRRTHGTDAGLKVARCAYLAGFDATSNVLAAQRYGIPPAGTMAHSYVRAFPDETAAFRAFAETYPDGTILLVDTYDTLEGTRQAARVGRELAAAGHHLGGVRLDSGDLVALSFDARRILDEAGLCDATIFVSGSLDEHEIARAVTSQAPIDGFGVGSRLVHVPGDPSVVVMASPVRSPGMTRTTQPWKNFQDAVLGVSADAPYLDMAYKLVADAGEPTLKLSAGKATWPGPKQVWRICQGGIITQDWITRLDEPPIPEAEPLLVPVMQQGKRLTEQTEETLATARVRLRREVAALPATCRRLAGPESPAVHFSPALIQVRERLASHIVRGLGQTAAA